MSRTAPIRPARELKSDAGDAERCPAELVDEIATELNYLRESHRTPEAFMERRDYLVKRLRRLARRLRHSPGPDVPRRAITSSARAPLHVPPGVFVGGSYPQRRETLRLKDRP